MRLLLDTHALLWWLMGDERLPMAVRAVIQDEGSEILVSAVSVWEIATKVRNGRLHDLAGVAERLPEFLREQGFSELSITVAHAQRAGFLDGLHRDPFDRMLAAQSQIEDLPIATADAALAGLGVLRFWPE